MTTKQVKSKFSSDNVVSYIRRIVFFSTILITIGVWTLIMFQDFMQFKRVVNQQREDHIQNHKLFIKDITGMEVEYIARQKRQFDDRISSELSENVCYAYQIATKFYQEYHGRISDREIKEMIIHAISSLSCSSPFSQVFIGDLSGAGIFYPGKPELSGKDLLDLQDVNGNWVVQNEIEFLKDNDEGFIWYEANDSVGNTENPQNKVTYVKSFAPFGWYFGSKCYLDDFYDDFKDEIAGKLSTERFSYGGYMFLNEMDGTPVVMDGEIYSGPFNFFDGSDSVRMEVFNMEVEAALSSGEGGFFYYQWNRPGKVELSSKISYVRYFSDCQWLVGAGFFEDEVDMVLKIQERELRKGFVFNFLQVSLLVLVVLVMETFIFIRFRRNYEEDFLHFARFFKIGKGEYKHMEIENLHFEEFREMGKVANEMIDERTKVYAQLVAEQERALESDRLKTAFLANMSHEIRTPMNAIIGFSELINEGSVAESDKKTFLKLIMKNGEYLMNLINDIIDIAKIESNQLTVIKKSFDLNALLSQIELHYREYIHAHNDLDIHFDVNNHLPKDFKCFSDEFRLRQVLDNLIGNAIKFTVMGTVRLEVEAKNERVYFSVQDTGIGISSEDLDSIFERFVQAANQGKHNYGGTGLGLAISKNIVDLLGGEISVKSEVGKGTRFHFYILS